MSEEIIAVKNITKIYGTDGVEIHALRSLNLTIRRGEFTAIAGPSGSGKTTLLNIISGLDRPSEGKVMLAERLLSDMKGNELSDYRRDHIGFIFQSYNLIPVLSARENIEYIMLLQGIGEDERHSRVRSILKEVGMEDMGERRPDQLSGGQQQRVAVARAMVTEPDIILADEPTANLDSSTGAALLDMMRELNERKNMTFLFSTHDPMIMERAKRLVILKDGQVARDETRE
jgi:putative ABC transport system ATP-binding protein